MIESGSCGGALISTVSECDAAATALDLSDKSASINRFYAAWRIVYACLRGVQSFAVRVVDRGLVGQVERRGGGLALALGRDESATAGAALDHVVAPSDLEVAGQYGRRERRHDRPLL